MVFPMIMLLMFAYIVGSSALTNPEMGAFSWLSWFPLTSPVMMLVRVAVGVPFWELIGFPSFCCSSRARGAVGRRPNLPARGVGTQEGVGLGSSHNG